MTASPSYFRRGLQPADALHPPPVRKDIRIVVEIGGCINADATVRAAGAAGGRHGRLECFQTVTASCPASPCPSPPSTFAHRSSQRWSRPPPSPKATSLRIVGSDPGDGRGGFVLHYDGSVWTRLATSIESDFWWCTALLRDRCTWAERTERSSVTPKGFSTACRHRART